MLLLTGDASCGDALKASSLERPRGVTDQNTAYLPSASVWIRRSHLHGKKRPRWTGAHTPLLEGDKLHLTAAFLTRRVVCGEGTWRQNYRAAASPRRL